MLPPRCAYINILAYNLLSSVFYRLSSLFSLLTSLFSFFLYHKQFFQWPKKTTLDTLDCPCDSGTSTINCNTADFPTLEGQCPMGYTFNSASRLSSSFVNVALVSLLVALLHMLI